MRSESLRLCLLCLDWRCSIVRCQFSLADKADIRDGTQTDHQDGVKQRLNPRKTELVRLPALEHLPLLRLSMRHSAIDEHIHDLAMCIVVLGHHGRLFARSWRWWLDHLLVVGRRAVQEGVELG